MPNKKKTTKRPAAKGGAKKSNTTAKKKTEAKEAYSEPKFIHTLMPFILIIAALFVVICLFFTGNSGDVGKLLHELFLGMFSISAYFIPILLCILAFFWKSDAEDGTIGRRVSFAAVILVCISSIIHSAGSAAAGFNFKLLWKEGINLNGGGVLGGVIGNLLKKLIGTPGLLIVTISLLIVFTMFFLGITPSGIAQYIAEYISIKKERRAEDKKEQKLYKNKPEPYMPDDHDADYETGEIPVKPEPEIKRKKNIRDVFENAPEADLPIESNEGSANFHEHIDIPKEKKVKGEKIVPMAVPVKGQKKFPDEEGIVNIDKLFDSFDTEQKAAESMNTDDEPPFDIDDDIFKEEEKTESEEKTNETVLEVERKTLTETPVEEKQEEKKPEPEKPKYVFPPMSLLKQHEKAKSDVSADELRTTASKLVDTLASFKVNTKLVDIAKGPAITRYELQPEEGVRVSKIKNLADDIALNLASSGIRIEAPIPGKAAVGIEVPNKNVSVVGLREQLENPTFTNHKSRLFASLGMDVAGEPVYLDVAKMPHLLIAGATGQGKSVCINSIIVSLLYKATPEEVKLILIDPKAVEFVTYNGLPHLLVPVVNEPKKAAGALHWAVAEMERRFDLIASVGVRDIFSFNMATKDDPTYEYMPQIVIIIDELADLMMTAPNEVEDSICRLAQKARAAGMHLILGTQRPSVNVVTGLIKANIPSRISCKTTSQVDSRTILDMAGAEKLVGRGDMLYAPVGAPKPIRVQGSFVSESEVNAITDFIRTKAGESEYDNEVIEKIEKEAAKCGTKKGSSGIAAEIEDDGDTDPMLKSAIELAIESGKISTSLIQRKLSLGYGRAAKLIDKMEVMGIVGPKDGAKPRDVLMSRSEYSEMIMREED